MPPQRPYRVQFELPANYHRQLMNQAELNGVSPHVYARQVLLAHFERTEFRDLRDDVLRVEASLEEFRAEFDALKKRSKKGPERGPTAGSGKGGG